MEISDKTRLTAAKINSLIYYSTIIDKDLWDVRYKSQYLHHLRGLRKTILEFIDELEDKTWWREILRIIPPKVKSDQCKDIILSLKSYVEQETN